ncbi:MAG: hypothetical protein ACOY94_28995 [Bacillota bacterium]
MRRHRLMGIDPVALEAAMHERQQEHRAELDQLRSRLAAAEGRLAELRERKAKLSGDLGRLDAEVQSLLQEMDEMGRDVERPRQSLVERHRRAEEDMREGLAVLEREKAGWIDLERQVAEGVMAAVQPYLDLTRVLPDADPIPGPDDLPDSGGGGPHG